MIEEYQVKGSTLRSKFDFVRERFGGQAEAELKELFRGAGSELFLASSWYPFSLYDQILTAIAQRFYDGDFSRLVEVGEYSARKALTTVYRAYVRDQDFYSFLKTIANLHEVLYSLGKMTVTHVEGKSSCEIHLSEAPEYSTSDIYVAQGFYLGASALLGLKNPACRHRVDSDGAHFVLTWS
jgi:hypothetical protein